jgi:pyruvate,orthophosphate dikinase
LIEPAEGLARVSKLDMAAIRGTKAVESASARIVGSATSASVGVASGVIVLDLESARATSPKKPVILVRQDTDTSDIAALALAQGLLTARGGRTSHAAVIARHMNKVALVGCSALTINLAARTCTINGATLAEGELITLDGTGGRIFLGTPEVVAETLDEEIAQVEAWRKLTSRTPRVKTRAV